MLCATTAAVWNVLGAICLVVGLGNTTWWVTRNAGEHVQVTTQVTLWEEHASTVVTNEVPAGQVCQTSDECAAGTWCWAGDMRCLSKGDCVSLANAAGVERDCTKIPSVAGRHPVETGPAEMIRWSAMLSVWLSLTSCMLLFPQQFICRSLSFSSASLASLILSSVSLLSTAGALVLALSAGFSEARTFGYGFMFHSCATGSIFMGVMATFLAGRMDKSAWERAALRAEVAAGLIYGAEAEEIGMTMSESEDAMPDDEPMRLAPTLLKGDRPALRASPVRSPSKAQKNVAQRQFVFERTAFLDVNKPAPDTRPSADETPELIV